MQKRISNQIEALTYLDQYIPQDREFKFPGEIGLARQTYLLKLLSNPQNTIKVIHLAGTSGKGSTSYFISVILTSLGFRVGLSVSPILLDIKERFQINNNLISEQDFCKYLNQIIPAIEKVAQSQYGKPTYYEVLVALTYYIFAKEQVDYAVVETGLGGLLDGTNVVTSQNKIAVITQIGHDHTEILGNTLDKIATQKAGIIRPGNTVVTLKQNPRVLRVIEAKAILEHASFHIVDQRYTSNISFVPSIQFNFHYKNIVITDIRLQMMGSFQLQNCSLALTTTAILARRDQFNLDPAKVRLALGSAIFLGRMQPLDLHGQTIILDGAHNPQKMRMLHKNLHLYFPKQQFVFMVAFKHGKNYKAMLRHLIPSAKKIIITPFDGQTRKQGHVAVAEDVKILRQLFESLQFKNYIVCKNTQTALKLLQKDKKVIGVITGSLYLLSEIYPGLIAQNVAQVQLPTLG